MQRSERPHGGGVLRRVLARAHVPGGLFVVSCVSLVSLDDRRCPCADSYICCETIDTCIEPGDPCFEPNGGSAGAVDRQGGGSNAGGNAASSGGLAGSQGGTAPEAGAGDGSGTATGGGRSVDGGAGGVGEPEWRPVGPSLLDDARLAGLPDLEIAPAGTPYLAYSDCPECDAEKRVRVPVVQRFDGSWRALPVYGLPPTISRVVALAMDGDGMPHLLTDTQVSSFDGSAWQAFPSAVPGITTVESNFQVDDDGAFWATLWDESRDEISVVRGAGTGWEVVGLPVPGHVMSVRLVIGPGGPFLAHASADLSSVNVQRFSEGAWVSFGDFPRASIELAQAPDGRLYVATWQYPSMVELYSGPPGTLIPVGTLEASWRAPALEVAADGTLYATFLVEDFVNVSRWDGSSFRDVDSGTLQNGTSPELRLPVIDQRVVPFVAFQYGAALKVKKYE